MTNPQFIRCNNYTKSAFAGYRLLLIRTTPERDPFRFGLGCSGTRRAPPGLGASAAVVREGGLRVVVAAVSTARLPLQPGIHITR